MLQGRAWEKGTVLQGQTAGHGRRVSWPRCWTAFPKSLPTFPMQSSPQELGLAAMISKGEGESDLLKLRRIAIAPALYERGLPSVFVRLCVDKRVGFITPRPARTGVSSQLPLSSNICWTVRTFLVCCWTKRSRSTWCLVRLFFARLKHLL